jgi:protein TonB
MTTADARLTLALLVSAALHASLLFGVSVRRPVAMDVSEPILARIRAVPAAAEHAPAPAPAEKRERPVVHPAAGGAARLPSVAAASPVAHVPQPPAEALPAVEMPLLADSTWYPAAELDVFPAALAPVRPTYPQAAADAGVAGEVTLLLLIDDAGYVRDSAVLDALPPNTFDEAALAALRAARFRPGQRDGREVRSRILVKVVFNPVAASGAVSR